MSLHLPALSRFLAFVLLLRDRAFFTALVHLFSSPVSRPCCRSPLPLPLFSPFGPLLSLTPVYLCADSLCQVFTGGSLLFLLFFTPVRRSARVSSVFRSFPSFAFSCLLARRPALFRPLADGSRIPLSTSNLSTVPRLPPPPTSLGDLRPCRSVPSPVPTVPLTTSIYPLAQSRSSSGPILSSLSKLSSRRRPRPRPRPRQVLSSLPSGPFSYPLVEHQRDAFPKRFP